MGQERASEHALMLWAGVGNALGPGVSVRGAMKSF